MSKNIDFSKPLSEEDASYVQDRPWLLQDAKLSGLEVRYADDEDDTDAVDDSDADSDDEDEAEDYESWDKKSLKAEVARRNEERDEDEQIEPESDKNEDLRAALLADDANE